MKHHSLESKLEKYYKVLNNTKITIGNWAILDEVAYKRIKKTKIENINNIFSDTYKAVSLLDINNPQGQLSETSKEIIIVCESKKEQIVFKYNVNFIAIRRAETEYGLFLGEYDLIAVNKNYIYEKKDPILLSPKDLFSMLEVKLSRKAIKDLDYFR